MSGEERIEDFVNDNMEEYLINRILDDIAALTHYRIAKALEDSKKKDRGKNQ